MCINNRSLVDGSQLPLKCHPADILGFEWRRQEGGILEGERQRCRHWTHFIFKATPQKSFRGWWNSPLGHWHGLQESGLCGCWRLWIMSPQLDTVIAATLVGYREESLRAPQSGRTREFLQSHLWKLGHTPCMTSQRPALGLRARTRN